MDPWLVTGAAGFVGAHVCKRLLDDGYTVVGVDTLNDYYDPALKRARLERLVAPAAERVPRVPVGAAIGGGASTIEAEPRPIGATPGARFTFETMDVADRAAFPTFAAEVDPAVVVHLGAQAGVRHSLSAPHDYIEANLVGFANVLEACRGLREAGRPFRHLVYASSSSVYGGSNRLPFDAHDPFAAGHPISLYAATKRANELMAHSYSHLYGIAATGLRFFTVYGPYGRPDMAYWRFAEAIWEDREISIFGDGSVLRDFTYVDDVVESLVRVAGAPPQIDLTFDSSRPDPARSDAPWRVCNIGFGGQATVEELICLLEEALERPAKRRYTDAVPGDVPVTHADTRDLTALTGYTPQVSLPEGIHRFATWYRAWREEKG